MTFLSEVVDSTGSLVKKLCEELIDGLSDESFDNLLQTPLTRLGYLTEDGVMNLEDEVVSLLERKLMLEQPGLSPFLSPEGLVVWSKLKLIQSEVVVIHHDNYLIS